MNQRGKQVIRRSWHWIVLFLCTDIIFIFLILFTVLMLIVGWWAQWRRQKKDEAVLLCFLDAPGEKTRADVLARFGDSLPAKELCARLLSLLCQINELTVDLSGYREYIETWVHEVKTPSATTKARCRPTYTTGFNISGTGSMRMWNGSFIMPVCRQGIPTLNIPRSGSMTVSATYWKNTGHLWRKKRFH